MRTKSEETRRRIVEAAYYLFYRRGFSRVGMDDIAARARVTKRTMYLYFRSKDDLLTAALLHYSEFDRQRLKIIADRLPNNPVEMVESFFGQLIEWAGKPRYAGSGFTRLVVELADLPGHPARAISSRAKKATETLLTELLEQGRIRSPAERAREVMLLTEGAMLLMLIHGDLSYGEASLRAARRLLKR